MCANIRKKIDNSQNKLSTFIYLNKFWANQLKMPSPLRNMRKMLIGAT